MRTVVLLAVLASACDQGAPASPPAAPERPIARTPTSPATPIPYQRYVVRDDNDFAAKALVVFDDLVAVFDHDTDDCDALAGRVEAFGAANVTRLAVLSAYGKAHPAAERLLQQQFEPQTKKLIGVMTPVLTRCSTSSRLMAAFEKLARDANTQQFQQRPR